MQKTDFVPRNSLGILYLETEYHKKMVKLKNLELEISHPKYQFFLNWETVFLQKKLVFRFLLKRKTFKNTQNTQFFVNLIKSVWKEVAIFAFFCVKNASNWILNYRKTPKIIKNHKKMVKIKNLGLSYPPKLSLLLVLVHSFFTKKITIFVFTTKGRLLKSHKKRKNLGFRAENTPPNCHFFCFFFYSGHFCLGVN